MVKINLSQYELKIKPPIGYLLISIELILALICGCGLTLIGVGGGAWILGGILAGAAVFYQYRSRYNHQAQPNRTSRKVGQILIGLTVGFSVQNSDLPSLSTQLPIFGLLTLFLLISGGAIGYLYSRSGRTDLLTATLATTPGNIGVMASIAADYGRNTSLVALVQLMRFTGVTFIIPLLIDTATNISNHHDIRSTIDTLTSSLNSIDFAYLLRLCLVLILVIFAVQFGGKLKVPVAAFLCSILVGLVFNQLLEFLSLASTTPFSLPPLFNLIGQILLGVTIGEYWGVNPTLDKATVASASVPVALTFLAGFVAAGIAKLLTPWDWLTCLLVTSPGGSPEMIWMALMLHHNVEVVTAGHLVRLIAINLSLPFFIALMCYVERATQSKQQAPVVSYATSIEPE